MLELKCPTCGAIMNASPNNTCSACGRNCGCMLNPLISTNYCTSHKEAWFDRFKPTTITKQEDEEVVEVEETKEIDEPKIKSVNDRISNSLYKASLISDCTAKVDCLYKDEPVRRLLKNMLKVEPWRTVALGWLGAPKEKKTTKTRYDIATDNAWADKLAKDSLLEQSDSYDTVQ